MPAKWHKYSYSAQRAERNAIVIFLLLFISINILFVIVNKYMIKMYKIESSIMEPTISSGDLVLTTPLYNNNPDEISKFSFLILPKRGDLVVIAPAYKNNSTMPIKLLNSLVSFLTFQQIRLLERSNMWGEKPFIRRVVAFPGDSLYMENFILHIKTKNSAHYLSEFETSMVNYDIKIDLPPANWSSELPFSGSFSEIVLQDNELFVLCDNRLNSSDSRIWGPVLMDRIQAKVLFIYWPLNKFGRP